MNSPRLQGILALGGAVLMGAAVVAVAVFPGPWGNALGLLGALALLVSLVLTARSLQKEAATLRSNLTRSMRQHRDHITAGHDRLRSSISAVDQRMETAAGPSGPLQGLRQDVDTVVAGQAEMRRHLRSQDERTSRELKTVVDGLRVLTDPTVLDLWNRVSPSRGSGSVHLAMQRADARQVLNTEAPSLPVEVNCPDAEGVLSTPAAALEIGVLLMDLDLLARTVDHPGLRQSWGQVLRWLRPEVPVAGFSREPPLMALHGSLVHELSGGRLLPEAVSSRALVFHAVELEDASSSQRPSPQGVQ